MANLWYFGARNSFLFCERKCISLVQFWLKECIWERFENTSRLRSPCTAKQPDRTRYIAACRPFVNFCKYLNIFSPALCFLNETALAGITFLPRGRKRGGITSSLALHRWCNPSYEISIRSRALEKSAKGSKEIIFCTLIILFILWLVKKI